MKIEKILLVGLVLVFAIGSAIASAFQMERVHVIGKTAGTWRCVPTDVFCDEQGTFQCVVRIPVSGVNTNVHGYKGLGAVSPETLCTSRLRRPTSVVVNAMPDVPILEVHPWDICIP